MMALYGGGRPGSSRRVRLVPVRQSGMDHRAVARIVLALARQMAADEAVEAAADEDEVSSDAGTCARSERVASVGRCAANVPLSASPGSGLAERRSHHRHGGAHRSPHEDAAPFSTSGGTP